MAKLQGHFMKYKLSPTDAVTAVYELWTDYTNNNNSNNNSSSSNTNNNPAISTTYTATTTNQINLSTPIPTTTQTTSSTPANTNTNKNSTINSTVYNEELSSQMPKKISRGKRILTVQEVDKMLFNPQPGWDNNIKNI